LHVSTPTTIVPAPHTAAPASADEDRRLSIGIDARAATEVPAGRGRVVRELLRALAARSDAHRYLLYAREPWTDDAQLDERFQWRLLDARDPWWHVRAARAANRECDVFLSSNSYLTTRFLRVPAVTIVYDLATFERDMRPNRRSQAIERLTLGLAVRRSAALLAISQTTAEALIGRFPGAASRTVVAPLGVAPGLNGSTTSGLDAATSRLDAATSHLDPATSRLDPAENVGPPAETFNLVETFNPVETTDPAETAKLPSPGFVLAVGTLEPRKNLPRLVAAYSAMDDELQRRHPLVVAGALGWDTTGTLDALRSLGERCQMLGYVSDEDLAELYRRCAVFCYPSLGEGFGLPVLEAMAAGATVLTSNVSSLPEVGGEAVAYADPMRTQDISAQLQSLLRDDVRRAELSARARERAEEFSWEAFAEVVLGTLERAGGLTRAHVA
jgi:glycosyltransferase involved in cell wall biosynthesis